VDDLLRFWDPGVWFSRTWKYPSGRLFRAAVLPLVCDILAARQVVGVGAHRSAFFCSFCYLRLDRIEDFNPEAWPRRYADDHKFRAAQWRDAPTAAQRTDLFKLYGVRWSELLRLPYWDPIRYTAVDSMHNLYLGLFQSHCREIWGIDPENDDGDAAANPLRKPPAFPASKFWNRGVKALYYGTEKQLLGCQKAVLWHLCDRRGLRRAGGVKHLVKELMRWKLVHPEMIPEPPPSDTLEGLVAKAEESLVRAKSAKTMIRKTRPVLVAMCVSRGIRTDDATVPVLAERLWEAAQQAKAEVGPRSTLTFYEQAVAHHAALGRQSLAAYEHVRENMELPSWISAGPKGFGTTQRGKLSADQWHTVCTVVLPVALIWAWDPADTRKMEMLSNFMDLVTAVVIAGLLETSPEHIALYRQYMLRYLNKMKALYPEVTVKPNHHFALHIPDFLEFFAPTHSWRSFAFERFNYMLQRLNTNLTFGQLESTFMQTSCRAANLRPLLNDHHIGAAFQGFTEVFRKLSGEDERGLRLDAVLRGHSGGDARDARGRQSEIRLDDTTYRSLMTMLNSENPSVCYVDRKTDQPGQIRLPRMATQYSKLLVSGIYYHSYRSAPRDSNVLFMPTSSPPTPSSAIHVDASVGQIQAIFTHTRGLVTGAEVSETFLVVSRFTELEAEHAVHDRFRRVPIAGGRLVYDKLEQRPYIIRASQVVCHIAKTRLDIPAIKEPCVHILPLDRVS
ncbi:hypothetical protein C8Q76DRAFT_568046, partial [Earliella scabrosa]